MLTHNIDPVLLRMGPLQVRYYGLAYLIGFLLAYLALKRAVKKKELKLTQKEVDDFLFYSVLGVILGGRVGYFLFYHPLQLLTRPDSFLYIWQGGMSFHGGFLGAILAAYLFCKKKNVSLLKLGDVLVMPAAIALGLGRIANFINGELVGTVTNVAWCFNFPGFEGCRHPAQLYLALKNFAVAAALLPLKKVKARDGFLFWSFTALYGAGRFILEFWKEDPTLLGLSMGQYLSLAMALTGAYFAWKLVER